MFPLQFCFVFLTQSLKLTEQHDVRAEYLVRLLNMDERPCIGHLSFRKLPDWNGIHESSERGHASSILRPNRSAKHLMLFLTCHLSLKICQ
jgi:hypothetical protein